MDARIRWSLACYLLLTLAGSAIFWARALTGGSISGITLFLMWVPGLAAMVTQLAFCHTLAGLGWRPGNWRYLLFALLIPLGYCLVIYVPVWLSGLGGVEVSVLTSALVSLPIVIMFSLITALGEEIGWRGFLVPALDRLGGFPLAALGSGVIWGLWHVPLIIGADYNAGTPAWYAILCFIVSITGISVMLAWLRLRSGSLWSAAIFHASHNATIQWVFDPSTVNTGPTPYVTTEFGIGLTIAAGILAIYFWRRRGELPAPAAASAPPQPATSQP